MTASHASKRGADRLAAALGFVTLVLWAPTATAQSVNDLDRAIALFEAEQFTAAQPLFERATAAHPTDATPRYYLGRIMFDREFYEVALDWFEKATELAQDNSDYQFWLGRARLELAQRASLLSKLSHATKAKRAFEKAIELDGQNVDAHEWLAQYLWNAPGTAGGDKDRAMTKLSDVARLDPARAYRIRADFLLDDDKFQEAIVELQMLVDEYSDRVTIGDYITLGSLYQRMENFENAFTVLERAVQQEPSAMGAYYQIGRAAAVSGMQLDRGIEALQTYISQDPPPDKTWLGAAHWRLGMLYEQHGDAQSALTEYERAARIDPERKEAKEAARRLQKNSK